MSRCKLEKGRLTRVEMSGGRKLSKAWNYLSKLEGNKLVRGSGVFQLNLVPSLPSTHNLAI